MVLHPKPDRVFGPEPWKTLRGETFDDWDLWFLVVMSDLPHGKRELVTKIKLKTKDRFFSDQRDAEAKLSHLLDLETRLLVVGLTHEDLLDGVTIGKWLRRRAGEKVLQRSVGGYPSPAMTNTPRKLLSERAMRGHWDRFPVSPSKFEPIMGHELTRPSGYYDYRMTPVMLELLDSKWEIERRMFRSPEEKVALDRLVLTVLVRFMNHIDDDDDASPVFDEVLRAYVRDVWASGVEPEVILRDGIEFGIWEDYGLTWDFKVFLEAIPEEHLGMASTIFAESRAELIMNGLEGQHGVVMDLWITFAVVHEQVDEFSWLAERLKGEGWSHQRRADEMAEVAVRLGRGDVAEAVMPSVSTA